MPILRKTYLLTGTVALALVGLTACGNAGTSAAENPAETSFDSSAIMPTVTPNQEPLPSAHPNSIQPETTLSISAKGNVMREPDIALISAGVQSEAKTAAEAMKTNSTAMNGVFRALETAKIAKKDMQTSNFSLQPKYDYSNRSNGTPPRLIGYTASNQLSVKVRDLDKLGQTMDALVEAGGNTFSGLQFSLDDDRTAKDEARQIAMRNAITRAELYAQASGYSVARVVSISESGGYAAQPMGRMSGLAEMADSTPIASGEVGYSITVNVVFELRK